MLPKKHLHLWLFVNPILRWLWKSYVMLLWFHPTTQQIWDNIKTNVPLWNVIQSKKARLKMKFYLWPTRTFDFTKKYTRWIHVRKTCWITIFFISLLFNHFYFSFMILIASVSFLLLGNVWVGREWVNLTNNTKILINFRQTKGEGKHFWNLEKAKLLYDECYPGVSQKEGGQG